jgi:separase
LILGNDLQALPWESLPVLDQEEVCRMPSLEFLRMHATRNTFRRLVSKGIDLAKTRYVLNPSGDLVRTQQLFSSYFEENGWTGVIGTMPSPEEYQGMLSCADLFVYVKLAF